MNDDPEENNLARVGRSRVRSVALASPFLFQVKVSVQNVTGQTVTACYEGLPGNLPNQYKNFVAIWSGSIINFQQPPLKKYEITNNEQSGSVVLDGLSITKSAYTVAYGVGTEDTMVAATAMIMAGGTAGPQSAATIGLNAISSDALSINYSTPPGYTPGRYKNWIALWRGEALPYTDDSILGKVAITSDANVGDVGMNNVSIDINTPYTLAYFVGAPDCGLTTVAAYLYFRSSDKNGG